MRRLLVVGIALLCAAVPFTLAGAQVSAPIDPAILQTDVYVTTQFHVNLREGPSVKWAIIETLAPGVTLPATGRTTDSGWVQVVYQGGFGWMSTRYVVWSGDLINLTVDGIDPLPYVRRVGVSATTFRETPIYDGEMVPSRRVGVLPIDTVVEVVGRLGYSTDGLFNVQILYNGQLYWVGAWNLRLTDGRYRLLLDNSYRFAYSRLARSFSEDISKGNSRLSRIENIWLALQRGEEVRCDTIPAPLPERLVSDSDLSALPQFEPVAVALDTAIGHTNTAIAMFQDACTRAEAYVTQQAVRTALDEVDSARQHFNVAQSVLISLQRRDPVLGDLR